MKEFINGVDGKLESHYNAPENKDPEGMALILHPHPQHGGTMNNRIVYNAYKTFKNADYAVMRFNFRGVGRSGGIYDKGVGELTDAATALNWLCAQNESVKGPRTIVGYSFGAWIGMQLLMRRPDISRFVIIAPPILMFDFNFLAPCPNPGIVIYGENDPFTPKEEMEKFINHLRGPKKNDIQHVCIPDADHYFKNQVEEINREIWKDIQFAGTHHHEI